MCNSFGEANQEANLWLVDPLVRGSGFPAGSLPHFLTFRCRSPVNTYWWAGRGKGFLDSGLAWGEYSICWFLWYASFLGHFQGSSLVGFVFSSLICEKGHFKELLFWRLCICVGCEVGYRTGQLATVWQCPLCLLFCVACLAVTFKFWLTP